MQTLYVTMAHHQMSVKSELSKPVFMYDLDIVESRFYSDHKIIKLVQKLIEWIKCSFVNTNTIIILFANGSKS